MITAAAVHGVVEQVAPIDGVSLGKLDDKSTWRIDFKTEATPEQRIAGQEAMDALDVDAWEAEQVVQAKKRAALDALAAQRHEDELTAALTDPKAPQAVKDYAAAMKK